MSPRKRLDDPAHKLRELMKKWRRRPTPENPRFSERYLNNDLHFGVHILCGGGAQEFCASFEHWQPSGSENRRPEKMRQIKGGKRRIVSEAMSDDQREMSADARQQQLVLIGNVKIVEKPKVAVSSLVRLQDVYSVYYIRAHSLYRSQVLGWAFGGTLANRKMSVLPRRIPIPLDESPGQVIESAPKVVDGIADNADNLGRDRAQVFDFVDAISGLRILLGTDFAWVTVAKGADPALKITDVVLGPFDFDASTI